MGNVIRKSKMCNRFNRFLWQWVRCRDFLMKHTVKLVKLSTAILLLTTATMFGLDEARIINLPDFQKFSYFDTWFWTVVMGIQALFQFIMMYCNDSMKCRAWGDLALQLSGLSLIVVGAMFGAKYPLFSWQMAIFPFVGLGVIVAGRSLNKRTCQSLKVAGRSLNKRTCQSLKKGECKHDKLA